MNPRDPQATPRVRARKDHLRVLLPFVFLGSLGTGLVTSGVFFITKHAYAFTVEANFALGFVLGVTYIVGALGVAPVLRGLAARKASVATRGVTKATVAILGLLCVLPWLGRAVGPGSGAWAVWLLILLYSPLTGVLWPIVESYLSGGRRGNELRSALGRFNFTWAGALIAAYFGIAPILVRAPELGILALGAVHLGSLALVARWGPEPGRHFEDHEPHPPVYSQLLATFRVLLPTSYVVLTALTPYLPTTLSSLDVPVGWQTPLAAVWLGSRVLAFVLMERWQGWHGRWYPAVVGSLLMVAGFSLVVLSPRVAEAGGRGMGLAVLVAGLVAFGVGMAAIYAGALYYAMEVGRAEVSAGGKHEALIGLGYAVGPLCGLAAVAGVRAGLIPEGRLEVGMMALVWAVSIGAAGYAARASWRAGRIARSGNKPPRSAVEPITAATGDEAGQRPI